MCHARYEGTKRNKEGPLFQRDYDLGVENELYPAIMQNEIRTINVLSVEEAINSMGENRLQERRKAFELGFEKEVHFGSRERERKQII